MDAGARHGPREALAARRRPASAGKTRPPELKAGPLSQSFGSFCLERYYAPVGCSAQNPAQAYSGYPDDQILRGEQLGQGGASRQSRPSSAGGLSRGAEDGRSHSHARAATPTRQGRSEEIGGWCASAVDISKINEARHSSQRQSFDNLQASPLASNATTPKVGALVTVSGPTWVRSPRASISRTESPEARQNPRPQELVASLKVDFLSEFRSLLRDGLAEVRGEVKTQVDYLRNTLDADLSRVLLDLQNIYERVGGSDSIDMQEPGQRRRLSGSSSSAHEPVELMAEIRKLRTEIDMPTLIMEVRKVKTDVDTPGLVAEVRRLKNEIDFSQVISELHSLKRETREAFAEFRIAGVVGRLGPVALDGISETSVINSPGLPAVASDPEFRLRMAMRGALRQEAGDGNLGFLIREAELPPEDAPEFACPEAAPETDTEDQPAEWDASKSVAESDNAVVGVPVQVQIGGIWHRGNVDVTQILSEMQHDKFESVLTSMLNEVQESKMFLQDICTVEIPQIMQGIRKASDGRVVDVADLQAQLASQRSERNVELARVSKERDEARDEVEASSKLRAEVAGKLEEMQRQLNDKSAACENLYSQLFGNEEARHELHDSLVEASARCDSLLEQFLEKEKVSSDTETKQLDIVGPGPAQLLLRRFHENETASNGGLMEKADTAQGSSVSALHIAQKLDEKLSRFESLMLSLQEENGSNSTLKQQLDTEEGLGSDDFPKLIEPSSEVHVVDAPATKPATEEKLADLPSTNGAPETEEPGHDLPKDHALADAPGELLGRDFPEAEAQAEAVEAEAQAEAVEAAVEDTVTSKPPSQEPGAEESASAHQALEEAPKELVEAELPKKDAPTEAVQALVEDTAIFKPPTAEKPGNLPMEEALVELQRPSLEVPPEEDDLQVGEDEDLAKLQAAAADPTTGVALALAPPVETEESSREPEATVPSPSAAAMVQATAPSTSAATVVQAREAPSSEAPLATIFAVATDSSGNDPVSPDEQLGSNEIAQAKFVSSTSAPLATFKHVPSQAAAEERLAQSSATRAAAIENAPIAAPAPQVSSEGYEEDFEE